MDWLASAFEMLAFKVPRYLLRRQGLQLRKMWRALRGNPRVLILTNFFWSLPISFSLVYLQLYMKEMGLSEIAIGSVASAQLVAQVMGALLGGWLADRLGHKKTLMIFDGLLWPAAFLLYSLASGYWMFFSGAVLIGATYVVMPSWVSISLNSVHPSRRPFVYTVGLVPWLLAGIVIPLTGQVVSMVGVTKACRILYLAAIGSVAIGLALRFRMLKETGSGHPGLKFTVSEAIYVARSHWLSFLTLVRRREMAVFFAIQVLVWTVFSVMGTYVNLYLVDRKGVSLDPAWISTLPFFRGTTSLLMAVLVMPFVSGRGLFGLMLLGAGLMGLYNYLLLTAPAGAFGVVIGATVIWGGGWMLFNSTMSAHWANLMSDEERPRLIALTSALTMFFTAPAPTIAGGFYEIHPSGPLYMVLGFLSAIFLLVLWVAIAKGGKPRTTAVPS